MSATSAPSVADLRAAFETILANVLGEEPADHLRVLVA